MPLLGFLSTGTFALAIPILLIFGGIAVAITAIIMSGRTKELVHKERLIALDKGIDLPAEPVKVKREKRPGYFGNRTAGLVLFCLGVSLTIALFATAGSAGVWGLPTLAIGVGLLISAELERREYVERGGSGD
jgi:hypothetical protein